MKYEDSSQKLQSHNWSKAYQDNFEKVFGKKETWLDRKARQEKEQQEATQANHVTTSLGEHE